MAPRTTIRRERSWTAILLTGATLALLLPAGILQAADPTEVRRAAARQIAHRGPGIDGRIPDFRVNHRLHQAYLSAIKRVERLETCQGLFDGLGADGTQVLADTTYVLAQADWEVKVCADASAFTTVGGSKVWLCSNFGRLPEKDAAEILLHEALHNAGLSEQPYDPDGLTPDEIDLMVRKKCGF
jgi:hypothetical protein